MRRQGGEEVNLFRITYKILGGHVHCRLNVQSEAATPAKCGDFVVRRGNEFKILRADFQADYVGAGPADTIEAASTDD